MLFCVTAIQELISKRLKIGWNAILLDLKVKITFYSNQSKKTYFSLFFNPSLGQIGIHSSLDLFEIKLLLRDLTQ